jgi:hypothetical protein
MWFPAGCWRCGFHLQIDLGIHVRGVTGTLGEPQILGNDQEIDSGFAQGGTGHALTSEVAEIAKSFVEQWSGALASKRVGVGKVDRTQSNLQEGRDEERFDSDRLAYVSQERAPFAVLPQKRETWPQNHLGHI